MMDEKEFRAALQAEYFHLQQVIREFGGRSLTIKSWSVTFCMAALVGAFTAHTSIAFLVSALGAFVFWFIEGQWKTFQYAYYARNGEIERYFRGEKELTCAFQVSTSWTKRWKSYGLRGLASALAVPHVGMPHIIFCVLGLALYALSLVGVVNV